jgi:hypothetical protein
VKNWDHTAGPNVKEGQRRVPDIICTDPYIKTVYIITEHQRLMLAQLLGRHGVFLTCAPSMNTLSKTC